MIPLLITIFIVAVLSSICSLVEAALFTVPINRVKAWLIKDEPDPSCKALYNIKCSMQRPIATIVILNNISNIVGSIVIGGIIANIFSELWIGIISGLFTLFIIIFSEVIPKTLGEKYADIISLRSARSIQATTTLFTPILFLISLFTRQFAGIRRDTKITEDEIRVLASLGTEQGVLEKEEEAIIQQALRLSDIKVKDIMTPRINMIGIDGNLILKDVQNELINEKYSRIPLFTKDIDSIKGLLYKVDALNALFMGKSNIKLLSLCREVLFVPENKTIDKLMAKLRITQTHTAIVIDEYGGTAGLVTLEDVLEELVGDIVSEDDEEATSKSKSFVTKTLSKDEIVVHGTTPIDEINKHFNAKVKNHRTVSKFILEILKRFPKKDEKIVFDGLLFTVEEITSKTIETIRVQLSSEFTDSAKKQE